MLLQVSRARADHQAWLRELQEAEAAAREKQYQINLSQDPENAKRIPRPNSPLSPWPEPDFYRIHIVAQEGAAVGVGIDSDGSAPVHTLEPGTIAVAYERWESLEFQGNPNGGGEGGLVSRCPWS